MFPTAALGQCPPFLACFPTVPEGLRWNHIAHPAWGQCGLPAGLEGSRRQGVGTPEAGVGTLGQDWGPPTRAGEEKHAWGRGREARAQVAGLCPHLAESWDPAGRARTPPRRLRPSLSRMAWRMSVGVLEGFLQPLWGLVVRTGCAQPVAGRPVPAHSLQPLHGAQPVPRVHLGLSGAGAGLGALRLPSCPRGPGILCLSPGLCLALSLFVYEGTGWRPPSLHGGSWTPVIQQVRGRILGTKGSTVHHHCPRPPRGAWGQGHT